MLSSIPDSDCSLEPAPSPRSWHVLQMAYRKHLEPFSGESRNDVSSTLPTPGLCTAGWREYWNGLSKSNLATTTARALEPLFKLTQGNHPKCVEGFLVKCLQRLSCNRESLDNTYISNNSKWSFFSLILEYYTAIKIFTKSM